jgi:hypothetical protein
MKKFLISCAIIGVSGCAACQQQAAAPAGIPMAGMTASTGSSGGHCDATPALGWRWETISFSVPKPKLFAVPKPQVGPSVVGIPILTGGPTMTMGAAPMMAAQPQMMAQPQMVQQQYVQAHPQSQQAASPQSVQGDPQSAPCSNCPPNCSPTCTEGCTSQSQVVDECDALMREISCLQQELCVETKNASVGIRQSR